MSCRVYIFCILYCGARFFLFAFFRPFGWKALNTYFCYIYLVLHHLFLLSYQQSMATCAVVFITLSDGMQLALNLIGIMQYILTKAFKIILVV